MLNVHRGTGGVFSWNDFIQQTVTDGPHHRAGFAEQLCPLRQQLVVVVFPLVPVTPTRRSCCDG